MLDLRSSALMVLIMFLPVSERVISANGKQVSKLHTLASFNTFVCVCVCVCDLKYVYIHTYEEEYDFTGVGDRLMEEAKKWFGCRMKPPVRYRAEYHLWRKWNDVSYNDFCFVRSKVAPIEDKGTGELVFSPTYKMNVSENRYKKVLAIGKFAFLKEQYKMDKEENKEADLFEMVR